jgi:hypothetical protein
VEANGAKRLGFLHDDNAKTFFIIRQLATAALQ